MSDDLAGLLFRCNDICRRILLGDLAAAKSLDGLDLALRKLADRADQERNTSNPLVP
jgi:hypothetical protein